MDMETEFLLIAACLQRASTATSLFHTVEPEWFDDQDHQSIFEAARAVAESGDVFSVEAVAARLVSVGLPNIATRVLSNPPSELSEESIQGMVDTVAGLRLRDNAIRALHAAENMLLGGHAVEDVQLFVNNYMTADSHPTTLSAKDLACHPAEDERSLGFLTGVQELDEVFDIQPGQMGIIAARPGVGKTALALQMAMKTASRGDCVAFASYEMTPGELVARLGLRGGEGSTPQSVLKGLLGDIVFLDGQGPDVNILVSRVSSMVRRGECSALVVDYVQQMYASSRSESRQYEMAEISGALKGLARSAHIPVLVLSQLNRRASVDGASPKLHDLRDSGALEQDADKVLFLNEVGEARGSDVVRKIRADVAKNRQGHRGEVTLGYFPEYQIFKAWRR